MRLRASAARRNAEGDRAVVVAPFRAHRHVVARHDSGGCAFGLAPKIAIDSAMVACRPADRVSQQRLALGAGLAEEVLAGLVDQADMHMHAAAGRVSRNGFDMKLAI